MILIADSGSTSVDWRIIGKKFSKRIISQGINPVYQDSDTICDIVKEALGDFVGEIDRVWFYGAGIISEEYSSKVCNAINSVIPQAQVNAFSDLTGAAVALLGDKEGIVAILGTGSNSGYYDGKEISSNVRAGGFILGDEGSGANIGKKLISDYVKGLMPEHLLEELEQSYSLTYSSIVENVYRGALPSRYLAQFTYFVNEHRGEPYIQKLLEDVFTDFYKRNILQYNRYAELEIGIIGSVAVVFKDELVACGKKLGVNVSTIEQSASDGLAAYFESKF